MYQRGCGHVHTAPSVPHSTPKGEYYPDYHLSAAGTGSDRLGNLPKATPHCKWDSSPEGPVSEKSHSGNAAVSARGTSFACRCSRTRGLGLVLAPLEVLEGVFGELQRTTKRGGPGGAC